jgi:pimeloyl-ACP methyl ester carboxylesterase
VLSETRYARSGGLGVAYRTTEPELRDLVFVSNWFTNCELLPELPSVRDWVERMSTLGRMVFFDQPGTGASDPVPLDALPTLELWSDSITAVLDDLGSEAAVIIVVDGALSTGALFAATHPTRTAALLVLEGQAGPHDEILGGDDDQAPELDEEVTRSIWGTGEMQHLLNPDMPWNEEIRAAWARHERLSASPSTVAAILPLVTQVDVPGCAPVDPGSDAHPPAHGRRRVRARTRPSAGGRHPRGPLRRAAGTQHVPLRRAGLAPVLRGDQRLPDGLARALRRRSGGPVHGHRRLHPPGRGDG